MKGVELPINVMVIVVLAIIVLIAIVVLFFGVWNPGKSSISLETAKNNACQMLVSEGGCDNPSIPASSININPPYVNGAKTSDTLQELCENEYGMAAPASNCKTLCGCSGIPGTP